MPAIWTVASVVAPFVINWLARGSQITIPDPWIWSLAAGLLAVAFFLFLRLCELEKLNVPMIELADHVNVITEVEAEFGVVPGGATRLLRIEVRNPQTIALDNCFVVLEDLVYPDGSHSAVTPVGLITQNQLLEGRPGGPFRLRAGQRKYVHIATMDESNSDSRIALSFESERIDNHIQRATRQNPYTLKIRAYGGGVPPEREFLLYVSDDGGLTMIATH